LSSACRLAAALLEQTVSSSSISRPQFSNLLLESARAYSNTRDNASMYSCYDLAIISAGDASLAWMTTLEAGQSAFNVKEFFNAIKFFQKAFILSETDVEKQIAGRLGYINLVLVIAGPIIIVLTLIWYIGQLLASAYIQQELFSEALKILFCVKPCQEILITKLLLSLNLKNHSGGNSKLSQLICESLEEGKGFQPAHLQYAVDTLKYGELDDTLLQELWMYLNIDQQQLLIFLCNAV